MHSNSSVSDDTVVDAPFHLGWKAGPLWSRAHEGKVYVPNGIRVTIN